MGRAPVGSVAALILAAAAGAAAVPFARGDDLVRVVWILCGTLLALALLRGLSLDSARIRRRVEPLEAGLRRAEERLRPGRAAAGLAAMICLYAVVWSVLSILRHEALNSSGFDLAIQHQVVWNLAHGRGFESSIEVRHYLGDHIALTLPLFAPFLWIWDDVRILLIAQSAALALGAWPLYRLAARRCGGPLHGLLWASVYLLTPAIGFMNKYDFHDLILALPFLLAAIDAVDEGRFGRASVWLALAMLTREEVGLAVAGVGVWTAVARRKLLWGGLWCGVSIAWAAAALGFLIPHFRGGQESDTIARYSWLGESPGEVVRTLVTRPWALFESHYHRVRRVVYPAQLLWPTAGLPLLGLGRLLTAAPNLAVSMTSSAISQISIYFQYNAPILPALFWAGVEGYRSACRRARFRVPLLCALGLCVAAANIADPAAFKDVPRPYAIVEGIRPRPNRDAFREAARQIPPDEGVLAMNHLAPHFSARRDLGVVHLDRPNRLRPWIVLDVTDTRHLVSRRGLAEEIARWLDGEYGATFFRDGILLLRAGADSDPAVRAELDLYLSLWVPAPEGTGGGALSPSGSLR